MVLGRYSIFGYLDPEGNEFKAMKRIRAMNIMG